MSDDQMRALVLTGPGQAEVQLVPRPRLTTGEALIDVERVGLCGTDVELFSGEMTYLHEGVSSYPLRPGHEWTGTVRSVGAGADPSWVGCRVIGDTMIGDGTCRRCRRGFQHVCSARDEVGVRDGRPGALAEQIAVPVSSLYQLPEQVGAAAGALVEPGGNAYRAAQACLAGSGDRVLVIGPGTIGLLVAMFLRAEGAEVHLLGRTGPEIAFARELGFAHSFALDTLPTLPYDAVVDATNSPSIPEYTLSRVEPGGRVVWIGLAGAPSKIDTRAVALGDITAVGILSGSPGLAATIACFASGAVDPTPLVGATVGLRGVADVLRGQANPHRVGGPKVHVDPRI